jgi:hypothetical protein
MRGLVVAISKDLMPEGLAQLVLAEAEHHETAGVDLPPHALELRNRPSELLLPHVFARAEDDDPVGGTDDPKGAIASHLTVVDIALQRRSGRRHAGRAAVGEVVLAVGRDRQLAQPVSGCRQGHAAA